MKNKVLIGIICLMLIVGLFCLTGCGAKKNKEEVTKQNTSTEKNEVNDDHSNSVKKQLVFEDTIGNSGYKTTFSYYDNDFEITKTGIDVNKKFSSITVESKKLKVKMRFGYMYFNYTKAYSGMKANASKTKYYTEYKWNKYDGYLEGRSENYLTFMLPLEIADSHDLILAITVEPLEDRNSSVVDACKSKTMQDFLNTIEYK